MGIFNNRSASRSGKNKKSHRQRTHQEYDLTYKSNKPKKAAPAPLINTESAAKPAAPAAQKKSGVPVKRVVVRKAAPAVKEPTVTPAVPNMSAATVPAAEKPEAAPKAVQEKKPAAPAGHTNSEMLTTSVSDEEVENLPDDSAARPKFNFDNGGMGGIDVSALDLSSLDDYIDEESIDEPEDDNIYSDDDDDYTFDADPSSIQISEMDR